MRKSNVYFSLGSNSGNRKSHLQQAVMLLCERVGELKAESSVYESDSWGYSDKSYLNQVICLKTDFKPQKILEYSQLIEKQLGRRNKSYIGSDGNIVYSARSIDIDILFYDNEIIESKTLTLPHPNMHLRNFVLVPLNEISPDYVHPKLNINVAGMLDICSDGSVVKRCNN